MDLILPVSDGDVHLFYDEGSGSYEVIDRDTSITIHHDHLHFDTRSMQKVLPKSRERLLAIREELNDRVSVDAYLISRTRAKIKEPLGPDAYVIRLHALLTDIEMSINRISARSAKLIELEKPFVARKARDSASTLRLLDDNSLSQRLRALIDEAQQVREQRDTALSQYPYFTRIATEPIAARLLTLAGSMRSLAASPASKVQLLGAEAALFRHLRNPKQRVPKHGVIHEHPLMQRVAKHQRGRFARTLADKIVIAARVDYFGQAKHEDIERTWNELETFA